MTSMFYEVNPENWVYIVNQLKNNPSIYEIIFRKSNSNDILIIPIKNPFLTEEPKSAKANNIVKAWMQDILEIARNSDGVDNDGFETISSYINAVLTTLENTGGNL